MTRFIDRRNYIECENIKDLKYYLSGYKLWKSF
jgi:predicted metal-dependent hydrolase